MSAEDFVKSFVAKRLVSLSGNDWNMVIGTLDESADNCHRCAQAGCAVCHMTREIARRIEAQLPKSGS